ncbi:MULTISPECIES: phosphatase [unclassified Anaerobiospirillum]|uniref:phosphatase n=1 Tax=unclassified Anaerobiospirillum TaxID=2647410 RepID=UPI001FF41A12|nr:MULTISPECIES: phosphatase [unclassified Anaerobiospirillum]MCK0526494.1 phosphatase [Anaerobiospirillum sp. NML120449]MCK0535914.1 phosphatase [Anaerobiospirillum sp. NML120511]MCK0541106.1 phosphatase [Anaerobiospirillum sp. NML02-A-032]
MRFLVDLHTHTVASDHAYSTINDYVLQAQKCGIAMFATTDHGPDVPDAPHPWHFGNLRVIPHVVDNIAILRGVEANLRADGTIDLEDYILDRLDIVLAGFHPSLDPTTEAEHTEIVKKVIASGKVDIITHLGNPRYPVNFREVLECAKEHNVAIELNSSSNVNTRSGSRDNCIKVATLAKEIGNVIALGSDAHVCYFLGNFKEAEQVIEAAGICYDQVINTSPMKVLDFLESRGREPIKSLHRFFAPF